jgi:lysyl-tRNA synthetase, class II
MGREDEIIKERFRKIEEMRKAGLRPYEYRFDRKSTCAEIQTDFKDLKEEVFSGKKTIISGRLVSLRDMGKLAFGKIQDYTGYIQIVFQEQKTPKESFDILKNFVDLGDILGIEGEIFKTKRGELSISVEKIKILTKSVLPLPDEFYGLKDVEERYRKRYIDLILNQKSREVFQIRAKILEIIRSFMKEKNFLEVETPLLQAIYGGAAAKPFKTHCDAFNSDVFLSIAPELYLKKAMIGGLGSVYEITKKFRNEGVDRSHNPEHMTIEWYQENADYNDGMDLFEELMKRICISIKGKPSFEYQGNLIDLSKWERLSMDQAIMKYIGVDVSKIKTNQEAKEIAKKHGVVENVTLTNLPDELMKTFRDRIIQPTLLMDYPLGLAPLAKPCKNDPTKAEIFQPILGGLEIGRAYSELSDPSVQEEHFLEQEQERKIGNKEAMPTDGDFVTALKYGLPPACGVGLGIERIIMLLTDSTSIRDVIMFPFMKPEETKKQNESDKQNKA